MGNETEGKYEVSMFVHYRSVLASSRPKICDTCRFVAQKRESGG